MRTTAFELYLLVIERNMIMFIIICKEACFVYNNESYSDMRKARLNIMPDTVAILRTMGEQIRMARLRRELPAELVAERAGISRTSLWKVESGDPSVAMGNYAAVLHALNKMDSDLLLIAKDDELGRQYQDFGLSVRKRAPKREFKVPEKKN